MDNTQLSCCYLLILIPHLLSCSEFKIATVEKLLGVGKTRCIARFPCDSTAAVLYYNFIKVWAVTNRNSLTGRKKSKLPKDSVFLKLKSAFIRHHNKDYCGHCVKLMPLANIFHYYRLMAKILFHMRRTVDVYEVVTNSVCTDIWNCFHALMLGNKLRVPSKLVSLWMHENL